MPPAVLDSHGHLDPLKVKLVTSCLNESNERLDPNKCATIVISLPPLVNALDSALNRIPSTVSPC